MVKRQLPGRTYGVALTIALLLAVLHGWSETETLEQPGIPRAFLRGIHSLEGRATDFQFQLRGPLQPHPDLVVVEVDEKSARRYGLWPWSRDKVAQGLRHLHQAGARAVGLDMVFTDVVQAPERVNAETLRVLEDIAAQPPASLRSHLETYRAFLESQKRPLADEALASVLTEAPEIVQGVVVYSDKYARDFEDRAAEQTQLLQPHLLHQLYGLTRGVTFPPEKVPFEKVTAWPNLSAQTPLPQLAKASPRMGYFNLLPDPDGTLRRLPVFAKLLGPRGFLTHFTVQTAAAYLGANVEPVYDLDLERLTHARLSRPSGPSVMVPLQVTAPYSIINHLGPRSVFPTVSFADVVDNTFDPSLVRGKAVLVGVSLVGNFDQRVTPFSEFEPGVFVNASFLSNILSGDHFTRPPQLRLWEILFIFAVALCFARLLPRIAFTWKLVVIIAVAGFWCVLDQTLFTHGIMLATVVPMVAVLSCAFAMIFTGYLSVDREKLQLRSTFQHYLNESVLESMLQNPDRLKLGGEKKDMTVLFSDIRGFTTLSETMAPEALVKFINAYLTPMTGIVFEEGGTLDKYIGDALMAFWGAPVDQPDHALRACRAAVRFLDVLRELKTAWKAQGLPDFDIGVGINSGTMIVGNMGSDIRFDYTVMGDSVNLASRLEGMNKAYGTRILISEATWSQVQGKMNGRRLGAVRVKGKKQPVGIYELRGIGSPASVEAETIRLFEKAVEAYGQRRFAEAETDFRTVQARWPGDFSTQRYLDELGVFKTTPPSPAWDGVFTATTK